MQKGIFALAPVYYMCEVAIDLLQEKYMEIPPATAKLHAAAQEMAKELLYVYEHPEYMTTHSEEETLRALLKKAGICA